MKNHAKQFRNAGISVLPVRLSYSKEGEKQIHISSLWKEYQTRFITDEEIEKKFSDDCAIGVICGKVSGNLEAIDFDEKYRAGIFSLWKQLIDKTLYDKLVITKTPTGGFHCLYRSPVIEGNKKLCRDAENITSIETRGEGGFVFEPPTKGYEIVQGDILLPPLISADERNALITAAISLSRFVEKEHKPVFNSSVGRPGDEFNLTGDIKDILEKHGWTIVREKDGMRYWRRPNKNIGISATENYDGRGLFHVFSTSTLFEVGSHTKFSVLATLDFKKDYHQAANSLREKGYGKEKSNGHPIENTDEEIIYIRSSDAKVMPIEWLWEGKIPKRKVTLIAGNPGKGKSQITLDIAARISSGRPFPLRTEKIRPQNVVILSAEDDVADTIKPRLSAMEADNKRVYIIRGVRATDREGKIKRRGFDLTEDMAALSRMVEKVGDVGLVIIDPISAYMGRTDSHKNADVRALMSQLSEVSADKGFAVICITHFNKNATKDSISKITGSLAFVAAARVVFAVLDNEETPDERMFLPVKNNIAKDTGGLSYSIQEWGQILDGENIKTSRVVWGDAETEMTANEALSGDGGDKFEYAKEFIQNTLRQYSDGIEVGELMKRAKRADISRATFYRAAKYVKHQTEIAGQFNQQIWKLSP